MNDSSIETRPYPNEHSARLIDPPNEYIRVRRTNGSGDGTVQGVKIPETIAVIWYIVKKDGKEVPIAQALRFPTKNWTAAEAKKWLKDKGIKYKSFEEAENGKSAVPENVETRFLSPQNNEMRIEGEEKRKIVGYAAKYGIFADLGWFKEKIQEGAFDDVLADDIRCLKNHDMNLILGRTKSGTLKLETNSTGLKFYNDVPDTTTGRDAIEEIKRGDITGCSFSFIVGEQSWKYFEDKNQLPERTIVKIQKLLDVGPVTFPAYTDTIVAARSMEEFRKNKVSNLDEFEIADSIKQAANTELTFEQKFEYEKHVRKAERLQNRLKMKKQAEA